MLSSLLSIVLIINELMASNAGVVMSPAYNFDSWIEVYNPTEQTIDLAGMYLSNDADNLTLWQMPKDIGSVPAKGFLVVWLGSDDILGTQAPFKLDCDGGTICLSDPSGKLITKENYPEALSRTAYARKTDGGNEWGWTAEPTPGATNTTSIFAEKRLDAPVVSEGSQLINGPLNFRVDIPEGTTLMYTTNGSMPTAAQTSDADEDQQPVWRNWVKNGDCEGDDESCMVCKSGDNNSETNVYFLDGVGYKGSRGIKVHSIDNPKEVWDSQFFVFTPNHIWTAGERYHFSMKVRADRIDHITPQTQRTPGSYIHWQMLDGGYSVTTEWSTIDYEGVITDEQAGDGSMQTIAFHLNESAVANNFYFDDIVWESYDEGTSGDSKWSKDGLFTVSRTTNYVFRLFREGFLPSVPVTRSFILTNHEYTTIPVVSIVGDERYFTDPMWGIDVKGTNGITGNGSDDPVNWNQPWDRPVNFSYISPTDGMLFNQDVNISVSGGWTRNESPRSMKLKSNKVFDGLNHLDYVFFPQKPYIRSKTLLVRNGGNDVYNGSRFMDPALTSIIQRSGIDLDVQSFIQVAEYVNGRFKGILNLREPTNDKFVYANYGYDDDEIDMFENGEFKNGTNVAYKHLVELSSRVNEAGVYDEMKTLLDVDEFANYMAAELYLGNDDWPDNNVKAYRSQQDGRFRFICYDLDYAFNEWDHTLASALDNYSSVKMVRLFKNLLSHDGFRRKFIDTFCIMAGSVFEKERVTAIVDEMADAMRPKSQYDGKLPDNSANKIKNKLQDRLSNLTDQLQQYKPMQLSGVQRQSVRISADVAGATIFINGIKVPYADFNGQLFDPVQLEAKAPAGYRFVKWEKGGSTYSMKSIVNLPKNSSLSMKACFAPLTNAELKAQGITPVRINEVSAANSIYVNEFFKRNDWVELYNTTDQDIDVEGMYLSDNPDKPQKYQISKADGISTLIPAHGYLVIWCDKLDPLSQLHAPFKLDAEGDELLLTAADGSWTDRFTYIAMKGDETIGRYPDGSNNVITMNVPTIAKANIIGSYATAVSQPDAVGISDITAQQAPHQIYNLKGQAVRGTPQSGIYIRNGRKIVIK